MKKKIKQEKGDTRSVGLREIVPFYKRWPGKATSVRSHWSRILK